MFTLNPDLNLSVCLWKMTVFFLCVIVSIFFSVSFYLRLAFSSVKYKLLDQQFHFFIIIMLQSLFTLSRFIECVTL